MFFGDATKERILNIAENLREFRDSKHSDYVRAGTSHKYGGKPFKDSVKEACADETGNEGGDEDGGIGTFTPSADAVAPSDTGAVAESAKRQRDESNSDVLSYYEPLPKRPLTSAERQLRQLAFAAPGSKFKENDAGMSIREQRQMARIMDSIMETKKQEALETSPRKAMTQRSGRSFERCKLDR